MPKLVIPPPNERQWLFLRDTHKMIAYGGARGGGKSWAVRTKAVLLCLNYPGIKCMIVRKTYPELQENHILPLIEMLHCYDQDRTERLASYNDQKKTITFPNSSRILFRYCDTDRDADRFQGTEVDVLFVDEATQQSEERMKKLNACVRGVNDFPKRVYYTCNPGGEGHGWVKRLFIDRSFKPGERPEDYTFIKALVTDNKALMRADPEYLTRLQALPEKLRQAWLEGDWDVFEGQFFSDFRSEPDLQAARAAGCEDPPEELRKHGRWCHVIDPIDLGRGAASAWRIYRSYDWGYAKPFSCAWWAVDYDGVIYRALEFYGCTATPNEGIRWPTERQFEEIAKLEREHPWLRGKHIEGVADPSIWDGSKGESVAETAARFGIYFLPGDNARIPGWMQCHNRLQFDENGYPRMYVFRGCEAFLRTIPTLVHSEHRPEDLDTEQEDHAADEWRYFCMSRPVDPLRPVEKTEDADRIRPAGSDEEKTDVRGRGERGPHPALRRHLPRARGRQEKRRAADSRPYKEARTSDARPYREGKHGEQDQKETGDGDPPDGGAGGHIQAGGLERSEDLIRRLRRHLPRARGRHAGGAGRREHRPLRSGDLIRRLRRHLPRARGRHAGGAGRTRNDRGSHAGERRDRGAGRQGTARKMDRDARKVQGRKGAS